MLEWPQNRWKEAQARLSQMGEGLRERTIRSETKKNKFYFYIVLIVKDPVDEAIDLAYLIGFNSPYYRLIFSLSVQLIFLTKGHGGHRYAL